MYCGLRWSFHHPKLSDITTQITRLRLFCFNIHRLVAMCLYVTDTLTRGNGMVEPIKPDSQSGTLWHAQCTLLIKPMSTCWFYYFVLVCVRYFSTWRYYLLYVFLIMLLVTTILRLHGHLINSYSHQKHTDKPVWTGHWLNIL